MQRLVFTNSNGVSIDLTKEPYGITKWTGFANANLNIQSQQVPFHDGSIFLDALIDNRNLSVTLAMHDDNDLEKRYKLRRKLISILNPKLGEGVLVYTNDFISKQIKCVPKIPLFDTHNSNTKGSPKASLAWTACDPYWEDLEETNVYFGITTQPIIENKGDVPCQMNIDFFTTGVQNPKLTKLNNNDFIEYAGQLNNSLNINTNFGKKSVTDKEIYFNPSNLGFNLRSIVYSKNLGLFVAVGSNSKIITSSDAVNWKLQFGTAYDLYSVTYSETLGLFVVVGGFGEMVSVIFTSPDGITWTERYSNSENAQQFDSVTYSETLGLFVAVGGLNTGIVFTSPDGITWTERTSEIRYPLMSVTYSETLGLFVAVGAYKIILTSPDGITWTERTQISTYWNLYSVTYSESLGLFVAVGQNGNSIGIYTSPDGITWTQRTSGITNILGTLYSVTYSETLGLFVAVGENTTILTSPDGIHWTERTGETPQDEYLRSIAYSEDLGLFVIVGFNGIILTTTNMVVLDVVMKSQLSGTQTSIIYSEDLGLFVIVGYTGIIFTSPDGITWTQRTSGIVDTLNLFSVTYSEKLGLFVAVGERRKIITSSNGIHWIIRNSGTQHGEILRSVTYSETLGLFVAVGGNSSSVPFIITSPDGIHWTERTSGISNSILRAVIYSETLGLFVAVGERGKIITSSNGIHWIIRNSGTSRNLLNISYSKSLNLFVVCAGSDILLSSDGITWTIQNKEVDFSTDVIYSEKLKFFIIISGASNVYISKFRNSENQIQNISEDSNMNLNLDIGKNKFRLNKTSGSFNCCISYRQRYIGV